MRLYKKIVVGVLVITCLSSFSGCQDLDTKKTNNKGYVYNPYTGDEFADDLFYNYKNGGMYGLVNGGPDNYNAGSNNNSHNGSSKDNTSQIETNQDRAEYIAANAPDVKWESTVLTAPGDKYSNPKITQGGGNSPIIVEATNQVSPGDSITVMGKGFSDTETEAYYVAGTTVKKAKSLVVNDSQMQITVDSNEKYGAYGVYVKNSSGTSSVEMINTPKIWWMGLTEVNAGNEVSIYGENLTTDNGSATNVYLIDGNKHYKMKVSSADRYKVTVVMPKGLEDGKAYSLKLHNGHGGEEAFVTTPEKITFKKYKVNEWTGKVINVAEKGVNPSDGSDDSAELQKIVKSADIGDTLYFPAGTYIFKNSVEVNVPLHFKGEGADKTVFKLDGKYKSEAMIELTIGPSEFSGISFEDVRKSKFEKSFINYRGDQYLTGSYNLYVHNCKFLQSTVPNARSQVSPVNARVAACVIIENNYFETTGLMFTSRVEKIFVRNNEVCGVCYCGPYYNQNYVLMWDTDKWDISGNKVYGKDLLTDPDGTLENNDQTIGRFIAAQGYCTNGYAAHNKLERVGLPHDNAGEQIMLENVNNQYLGKISSSTSNTITAVDVLKENPSTASVVTVVKGKGVGQYRHIKSVTDKKVTVSQPWTIIPDSTSEIMISHCNENVAIYKNDMNGFKTHMDDYTATTGVQLYGNCHNVFVVDNIFKNMTAGICITSHYRFDNNSWKTNGIYWSQFDNNNISNCSQGIRYKLSHMISPTQKDVTMYTAMGNTVRRNNVRKILDFNFESRRTLGGVGIEIGTRLNTYVGQKYYETWEGEWEFGTLVENNIMTDCEKYNILLCRHQGYTVLRNNSVSGTVTENYSLEEPCDGPVIYN